MNQTHAISEVTTAFTFFIKIGIWEIPQIPGYLRNFSNVLKDTQTFGKFPKALNEEPLEITSTVPLIPIKTKSVKMFSLGDERRFPGRFLNIQYWFQGEL